MHVNDHRSHDHRADGAHGKVGGRVAPEHPIQDGEHRVECRHGHTAQRHHAGGQQAGQKDDRQKGDQNRLDGQNGAARHQHAFAALEAEIQGLQMADNGKDRGQIHRKIGRERGAFRHQGE